MFDQLTQSREDGGPVVLTEVKDEATRPFTDINVRSTSVIATATFDPIGLTERRAAINIVDGVYDAVKIKVRAQSHGDEVFTTDSFAMVIIADDDLLSGLGSDEVLPTGMKPSAR